MNFKLDLTQKNQKLLTDINYPVEDKEYSKDDVRQCVNYITSHIMSLSSKNNAISNEMMKYDELVRILVKNEK